MRVFLDGISVDRFRRESFHCVTRSRSRLIRYSTTIGSSTKCLLESSPASSNELVSAALPCWTLVIMYEQPVQWASSRSLLDQCAASSGMRVVEADHVLASPCRLTLNPHQVAWIDLIPTARWIVVGIAATRHSGDPSGAIGHHLASQYPAALVGIGFFAMLADLFQMSGRQSEGHVRSVACSSLNGGRGGVALDLRGQFG